MHAALHASAPRIFFRRGNRRTFGERRIERHAREPHNCAIALPRATPADAFDCDAERDEAKVAVDHAFAGPRHKLAAQRKIGDVAIEQHAVVGARVHPRIVREQHAHRDRRMFVVVPLRQKVGAAVRRVRRAPRATRSSATVADEELRERGEIEPRIDIDRLAVFASLRVVAEGAFVDRVHRRARRAPTRRGERERSSAASSERNGQHPSARRAEEHDVGKPGKADVIIAVAGEHVSRARKEREIVRFAGRNDKCIRRVREDRIDGARLTRMQMRAIRRARAHGALSGARRRACAAISPSSLGSRSSRCSSSAGACAASDASPKTIATICQRIATRFTAHERHRVARNPPADPGMRRKCVDASGAWARARRRMTRSCASCKRCEGRSPPFDRSREMLRRLERELRIVTHERTIRARSDRFGHASYRADTFRDRVHLHAVGKADTVKMPIHRAGCRLKNAARATRAGRRRSPVPPHATP